MTTSSVVAPMHMIEVGGKELGRYMLVDVRVRAEVPPGLSIIRTLGSTLVLLACQSH